MWCFFFKLYGAHRDLHVLTHAFPTRRSSDLVNGHKGCSQFRTVVTGIPAHSSETEQGVSAVEIAARLTGSIAAMRAENRRRAAPDSPFSPPRSEEHTSELQSLMRISYAVFCLKKKNITPCDRLETR